MKTLKMIRIVKNGIAMLFLLFIIGCSVKPKAINYGEVACHYCSMTVVDKQHAAQIVTDKGKVFNFDASECMIHHLAEIDETTAALKLVNDYNNPGELLDATQSIFLISEGIPSPMGEFLTGFKTEAEASDAHATHGGKTYTWDALKKHFAAH